MLENLNHIIDQVVKDKGIDRAVLVEALESAVLSAANKKFRNTRDLEAHYNDELGEVEIFEFVTVVDEVLDSYKEIDLEEAGGIDPDVQAGDSLGMKMDAGSFSRIAAQTAKQVIIQKVREAEREKIFNEFKDRVGELVNGIVRRYERGDLIVDLGMSEGLLPHREQVPRENYRQGDRVRVYISEVKMATKGPQIILSRSHPNLVAALFHFEVPEIAEGIVEIKAVAREAGSRTKIAVASYDSDVDPVGACVGMRGSRVQNVVSELRGEKIDIIPWTMDVGRFACSALSPAEVTRIYVDNEMKSLEVIVPDDQLSLAIGKKGQNVRLAAKLTGWNIDIKSETRAAEAAMEEFDEQTGQGVEGPGKAEGAEEEPIEAGDVESAEPLTDQLDAEAEGAEEEPIEAGDVESAEPLTDQLDAEAAEAEEAEEGLSEAGDVESTEPLTDQLDAETAEDASQLKDETASEDEEVGTDEERSQD